MKGLIKIWKIAIANIIFLSVFAGLVLGDLKSDIRYMFVNNFSDISLYTWKDDSMHSEVIYAASDSFFIFSFDLTKDGKFIIIVEAIPYFDVSGISVDPNEDYFGVERSKLLCFDCDRNVLKLIDTLGGTYGEGANSFGNVWLAPDGKLLCAQEWGWEWNSLLFFTLPDFERLSEIPAPSIEDSLWKFDHFTPICWSKDSKNLFVAATHHGSPHPPWTLRYNLEEMNSIIIEKPLESLLNADDFLSQGLGPSKADRENFGIWSPDGSMYVQYIQNSKKLTIKDIESGEIDTLFKYIPTKLYRYCDESPAHNIFRVIWK